MTDADLDDTEVALGRPLPADYRQFMLTCPIPEWNRYCRYFYRSINEIARANRAMRLRAPDSNVVEPDGVGGYRERPWPDDWIAIGDGDSEWFTFVRPDAPGVWEWEHAGRSVRQEAGSFDEFLELQRERLGPPPVLEEFENPSLGKLSWDPERREWTAKLSGLWVNIEPRNEDHLAFLKTVTELALAAVAAEPRVLMDAMAAGGLADFREWEKVKGKVYELTAETACQRLGRPTLCIHPGPVVEYTYPAEGLDWFAFWVESNDQLAVTDQGWGG